MVIRAIHSNMLGNVLLERSHKGFEISLAAYFTDVLCGEVAVHAGAIPVALDRLAMQYHIHFVLLAEAHHQIASHPGVIGGLGGAFGEYLELPLAFGNFSVDAFMIDAGCKAGFPMLFDDCAGQAANVFIADAAVVRTLWSKRIAAFWEAERSPILEEEILLLKTNPQVRIVLDRPARVARSEE